MNEQQIITNLQQIIDLATKTTLLIKNNNKNNDNRDQQKLPKKDHSNNLSTSSPKCEVCGVELANPTHTLCLEHFKEKMQKKREMEEKIEGA